MPSSTLFDDIVTKGMRTGQVPARTKAAREWYRDQTKSMVKRVNERKLMSDKKRDVTEPVIGSMYLFSYDAKYKDELPYWDRLPLIFPFKKVKGGFLAINLHYLPPRLRARLMDGLYEHTNNERYDETTKIKLNYQLLKSVSKLRYFKPCVKHYLNSHVRSNFMYIYPSEWDIAIFLPLARFQKRTANRVYADSEKSIYNV